MKKRYLLLLALSGTIISLDLWTKNLILQHFHLGKSIELIPGVFSLTYVRNAGAAFGILNTVDPAFRIPFFIAMPALALGLIFYFFSKLKEEETLMAASLSLIVGGAIGNLIDRIRFSYVVDFLDFYWGNGGPHFPAFNVADSAITVGVSLMIIDIIKKERQAHASRSVPSR